MLYIVGNSANPGAHTDTRCYNRLFVNPISEPLGRKAEGAAGPEKLLVATRKRLWAGIGRYVVLTFAELLFSVDDIAVDEADSGFDPIL